jgi:cyclic-di-GMP-binding protein
MSVIFQRLAQALPERHSPGKSSFATEAKPLRDWIDHLPLANPSATARLLLNALHEMNQLRLDPAQRLAAMEAMRGPVGHVVASLDRMINADMFPLPPSKQQIGQQISEFDRELAFGYTALVHDVCAPVGAVPFLRGRIVAAALVRATQHFGALLYRAYLMYQAPPPGVWQMLHDLFQFAVAVRLDEKRVEDPLLPGQQLSVRDSYVQTLLFALSNPYRFTQRENAEILALTQVLGRHCELRPGRAPEGAIAVQVDRDAGPGYLLEEREVPREDVWAFQISGLTRYLDSEMARLASGGGSIEFRAPGSEALRVDMGLVERLTQTWTGTAARAHARLPAGHRLDCVIGLHSVHYVLSENKDFDAFLRSVRGVAISLREGDRVAAWTASASDFPRIVRNEVKVLDQSLSGYRLQWDRLDGLRVKVGELMALAPPAEDGGPQDWMIGTIRWLRLAASGALETGVALLSRRALPVGLRTFDAQHSPRAPLRGLLLEPLTGDGESQAETILAPHLFDRGAGEVEVMRPADPFDAIPEPKVELLKRPRIVELGSAYVQIVAGAAPDLSAAGDARETPANDADVEALATGDDT